MRRINRRGAEAELGERLQQVVAPSLRAGILATPQGVVPVPTPDVGPSSPDRVDGIDGALVGVRSNPRLAGTAGPPRQEGAAPGPPPSPTPRAGRGVASSGGATRCRPSGGAAPSEVWMPAQPCRAVLPPRPRSGGGRRNEGLSGRPGRRRYIGPIGSKCQCAEAAFLMVSSSAVGHRANEVEMI